MTTRALDENGDIKTSGTIFVSGKTEVEQTIKTRLKLLVGEYFRDSFEGTNWFDLILDKRSSLAVVESEIKRRIVRTKDVLRLLSFSFSFDVSSRALSVQAVVETSVSEDAIEINFDQGEVLWLR